MFAMTTAQLTGELKIGRRPGSPWDYGKSNRQGAAAKTNTRAASARPAFRSVTGAVLDALEKEDTLLDRLVGYGICGGTFFYLAAQVVRVTL
jgi:hypothetical protein